MEKWGLVNRSEKREEMIRRTGVIMSVGLVVWRGRSVLHWVMVGWRQGDEVAFAVRIDGVVT